MRNKIILLVLFFCYAVLNLSYAQNTLDRLGLTSATPSVGAYSLRKLSSAYTGPACRIRRSTDNTLMDIGFLASGALDTTALKTFVGSGNGFVRTWYDQSGNLNHITQSNAVNQPQLVINGSIIRQNDRPAITFGGGTPQFLTQTSGTGINGTTNSTLIFTGRINSADFSSDVPFIIGTGGTNGRNRSMFRASGSLALGFATWNNNTVSNGLNWDVAGALNSYIFVQNAQSILFAINGRTSSEMLPSAPGSVLGNTITVGTVNSASLLNVTEMTSSEFIAIPSAIAASVRETVECNQISHYRIRNARNLDAHIYGIAKPASCQLSEELITWSLASLKNVSLTGRTIRRIAPGTNWDGDAFAMNTVYQNGYLEFTATETNTSKAIGLSTSNQSSHYLSINYAFVFNSGGTFDVAEQGGGRGLNMPYATGDKFRISLEPSGVRFYRNNNLIFISNVPPSYPMAVDASLSSPGATFSEVKIANLTTTEYKAELSGQTPIAYQWFLNGNPTTTTTENYANSALVPGDILTCEITYASTCGNTTITTNPIEVKSNPEQLGINLYLNPVTVTPNCAISEQDIIWDNTYLPNLVQQADGSLTKFQGFGYDAASISINRIDNEGSLVFTMPSTNKALAMGLSNSNKIAGFPSIRYAFNFTASGTYDITESGTFQSLGASYADGDEFRISIQNNTVKYYQNENLVFISSQTPTLPLYADISLNDQNGAIANGKIRNYSQGNFTVSHHPSLSASTYQWSVNGVNVGGNTPSYNNAMLDFDDVLFCKVNSNLPGCQNVELTSSPIHYKLAPLPSTSEVFIVSTPSAVSCTEAIEDVVWNSATLSNIQARGNSLRKFRGNLFWNAGAVSLNTVNNSGYFEFTATETNTTRYVGLSNTDNGTDFTTIQFAIHLRSDGNFEVSELAQLRGSFGAYATGDRFRISVDDGIVRYSRNDVVFYISNVTPVLPLIADVAIFNQRGTVTNAVIANSINAGTFTATGTNLGTDVLYNWKVDGVSMQTGPSNTYNNSNLPYGSILTVEVRPGFPSCSNAYYSSNKIIIIEPSRSTTWLGTTDNQWSNTLNWSNGLPSRLKKTIIPASTPNIPSMNINAEVYDLEIRTGAILTIPAFQELTILHDLTVDGTMMNGFGKVIFVGCKAENTVNLRSTTNFYNVVINNPFGVSINTGTFNVGRDMLFTNGIVNQNARLVFLNGATATNASHISHVNGKVWKRGNQAFTFPVGKNRWYRPIGMSAPLITTDEYSAEAFFIIPHAPIALPPLNHVSDCEYWTLDRNTGVSPVSVTIHWDVNICERTSIGMIPDLRVARWNGSAWTNQGRSSNTGNNQIGSVTSSGPINIFGSFILGTTTVMNILPDDAISLSTVYENNSVKVQWTSPDQSNCSRYIVERSVNGRDFTEIKTIACTSSLNANPSIIDPVHQNETEIYYRVAKVKSDGQKSYSKTNKVTIPGKSKGYSVFPNPADQFITLTGNINAIKRLSIINPQGSLVKELAVKQKQNIDFLQAGVYYLIIETQNNKHIIPFIKK